MQDAENAKKVSDGAAPQPLQSRGSSWRPATMMSKLVNRCPVPSATIAPSMRPARREGS